MLEFDQFQQICKELNIPIDSSLEISPTGQINFRNFAERLKNLA